MSALIVHFEIGSTNSAELAKFYERMLGWKYMQAGAAAVIDDGGAGGDGHAQHAWASAGQLHSDLCRGC